MRNTSKTAGWCLSPHFSILLITLIPYSFKCGLAYPLVDLFSGGYNKRYTYHKYNKTAEYYPGKRIDTVQINGPWMRIDSAYVVKVPEDVATN